MAFSMYSASVPVCTQQLGALVGILDKAAAHCAAKKIDEAALLTDRLYPDMFTLARQIRQATDFGRSTPGRLAGGALPEFPASDDASFADAKARTEKSLAYVRTLTPAQIDGSEDRDITWMAGQRQMSFKGQAYLLHFGLPNFFFHLTTAYNILRHRGVELGKRDFLGSF
ncbi:MAG TPA: DUF1993 domain-containing protein [Acetobacteraceae bacterium]